MLKLQTIDHVHVYTAERGRAASWYERVLGLVPVGEFQHWATKDGPLFLGNAERTVLIALFERPEQPTRSTIAFRVDGQGFLAWRMQLQSLLGSIDEVDHNGSWSLYFSDPDGNPFEITSYDYGFIKDQLGRMT